MLKSPTSMSNILLFGGTFDPFHNGHYKMLDIALKTLSLEKVIIMPNFVPVNKKQPKFSATQRYEMLKASQYDFPNYKGSNVEYEISNFEMNQKQRCYSIDTINYLYRKFKNKELYLLIGSDNFFSFHLWKDYEKILDLVTLFVVNRRNDLNHDYSHYIEEKLDRKYYKSIMISQNKPINISSTKIREKLSNKLFLSNNVPTFIMSKLETII